MKKVKRLLFLKIARKMNKNDNSVPVPTIISENTTVKGNISSDSIIHIDGKVEGDVCCSELIIGIKGMVKGSVNVKNMQLYGTLQGKAVVDTLFVSKSAKLIGDATHTSIAIEPGAYIDGHCMRAGASRRTEQSKSDFTVMSNANNKRIG